MASNCKTLQSRDDDIKTILWKVKMLPGSIQSFHKLLCFGCEVLILLDEYLKVN